jgi:hypothetical protein
MDFFSTGSSTLFFSQFLTFRQNSILGISTSTQSDKLIVEAKEGVSEEDLKKAFQQLSIDVPFEVKNRKEIGELQGLNLNFDQIHEV